ncbi:uncharacterized protein LOC121857755 isoform X1 [Homarus americanus]|uniref:uncharacterized protein LOC121857755 isoform X1 n=1 Tax=Homarus americanus TaxID=6706 RepID=UPI001C474CCD|nr:uncharacterized protein LOC121857755 isoform X1 [Homarus americanus]
MSVREGTRRKKISVLHMLGTWEGKIDGCNCPSCKECDAGEKTLALTSKSPIKALKGPKPVAKKVSIKVKTTKVIIDNSKEESVAGRKISTKKHLFPKGAVQPSLKNVKLELPVAFSKTVQDKSSGNSGENPDYASDSGEFEKKKNVVITSENIKKRNISFTSECDSLGDESQKECDRTVPEVKMKVGVVEGNSVVKKESRENAHYNMVMCGDVRIAESSKQDSKCVLDNVFINQKVKCKQESNKDETVLEPLKIKQEPEEYFSDQEEIEKPGRGKHQWDGAKSESRVSKRARMVTSEMENIYAKPRMIFTGKGVVRKFEPGLDRTPKSRRGRKPGKAIVPVKVKQEPRDEEEDGSELDRLQRALSEAAESISDVGEELLDALHEFGEDPKKSKQKKKANTLFKRVDSDGDKYVECNMCFKMLKESSMKQHYKTHTGEKPHTCDECEARFTRKGDVERHKRLVHKNQKPFKCQKCTRDFSDRKNLKAHLQNHDKAIYYACSTCGFKFGKREYYENHIRYIHPLADGAMPEFPDLDEDLASKQLRQIEMEEKKEKKAKEILGGGDGDVCSPDDDDDDDDDEEEEEGDDKAMEITVTEGEAQNITANRGTIIKKEVNDIDDMNMEDKEEELEDQYPPEIVGKSSDKSMDSVNPAKTQVGTDVSISKGTISFTQTVPDTDSLDEELVNKVIAAAVSQATNTIESLQTKAGANMSENDVDVGDEEDEDEQRMLAEEENIQDMLDSNYDILPITQVQKPAQQLTEIHINASVGGQKRKFIIQVPPGSNLNVQTPEGMEMIVSMVNQLCAGKGDLDGPIEVVMHNPNTRTIALD